MGLFGKKKENVSKEINANAKYYSGELNGFFGNDPVTVSLTDDALTFKKASKGNPLNVTLERSRVSGMEVFLEEKDYMLKYHGHASVTTEKTAWSMVGSKKSYFVINYTSKDGTSKHLDFWYETFEGMRVLKLKKELASGQQVEDYSI